MSVSIGIDIGGTKCALSVGDCSKVSVKILHREEFRTHHRPWREVLEEFVGRIDALLLNEQVDAIKNIGISCGGPLDSTKGIIMGPPNLAGWDDVPIVNFFASRYKVPVHLQNDANACACAEWMFGAGRGARNMVFMTFGTGLGAGIIIDGKLYSGANGNAGEIGHIRLCERGPIGYNKVGSAEGFCSGAGMARLAQIRASEHGVRLPEEFTADDLFRRVDAGDALCTSVFKESARHLGMIIAYVIDILNPEVVVLGGVFMRQADRFLHEVEPILEREALPFARKVCRIVPAGLSESIGDYAALSVANIS